MIKRNKKQTGQSVVEYILVTAFVALAAIAIFRGFRADLSEAYEKAGEALLRGVNQGLQETSEAP